MPLYVINPERSAQRGVEGSPQLQLEIPRLRLGMTLGGAARDDAEGSGSGRQGGLTGNLSPSAQHDVVNFSYHLANRLAPGLPLVFRLVLGGCENDPAPPLRINTDISQVSKTILVV